MTILAFSGCGADNSSPYNERDLSFSMSALTGGSPLNDSEMAVALRVCYAFRTKRSTFKAEMLDQRFDFSYHAKNCDGQVTMADNFQTTLTTQDDDLIFESDFKSEHFSLVETDTHGHLSELCQEILDGETPLNVKEVGKKLYEYDFRSTTYEGDQIAIKMGSKKSPESLEESVTEKLILKVLTDMTSTGNYQGMVIEAKKYFSCPKGQVKYFQQNFLAP